MFARRLFPFAVLLALASCQESEVGSLVGPDVDDLALYSVIPPSTQVALPVTPTWVTDEQNYPPGGIAVASLGALEEYRMLSPLEEATHYASVEILPGGGTALAVAMDHIYGPPWTWPVGWSYLVKFDIKTGALIGKVLLEGVPGLRYEEGGAGWLMDVSRDGKFAYVSLFYSAALAVVDLQSMELVRYVHFPPALGPGTGSFVPMVPRLIEGDRALLINDQRKGQVLRVDTETFEFEEVYISGYKSVLISLSPNEKTLLVTGGRYLRVVDYQTGEDETLIPCRRSTGLHFPSRGHEVLVTCREENRLLGIDQRNWEVSWEIEIPGGPQRVSVDQSDRFAVVTTHFSGEVVLVDLRERKVVKTVALPNPAWEPVLWAGGTRK